MPLSKFPRWILIGAGILSFVSGLVNAIAILGFTHHAATHMTGLFSQAGIALFQNQSSVLIETGAILFSFLAGAVLTGMILRDAHLKMGRHYEWVLTIECALLFLSAWGFDKQMIWGEYCAAMAAGLQNAMASLYSGAIIRTTHLTGILTDLGVLLGRRLIGGTSDKQRIVLFLTLILAFTTGGFLGAWLHSMIGVSAMFFPAIIVGFCGIAYRNLRTKD